MAERIVRSVLRFDNETRRPERAAPQLLAREIEAIARA
jgi:hypothetical protein